MQLEKFMKRAIRHLSPKLTSILLFAFSTVAHAVSFSAASTTVAPGATATVSISTTSFSVVSAFQFTLQWDPSVLQDVSNSGQNLPGAFTIGTGQTSDGKLRVLWDDGTGNGASAADGTVVLTVQLKAIGANGTSSSFNFTSNPTQIDATVNFVSQTPSTQGATITVLKPKPTITWANPAAITYGTALSGTQLNATASYGGNTIQGTFAYTPSSGTILQTGNNQTLSVTFTPNDTATYDNATATATINVNKATPTLTWSNPADIGYGTALSGTQLNAAASFGGNSVQGTFAYTPNSGTLLGVGNDQTLSVTFTPTDSSNFNSASTTAKINVVKGSQTITFGSLNNKTFGDGTFNVSATASSSLPVSFSITSGSAYASISGSTVTITGAGSVTIRASQAGDNNYNAAANVDQTFTIAKASQTITFGTLANKTFNDPAFNLSATASSGLTVSFAVVSGPATISGTSVTVNGVGTVVVRASQSGNANYNAAADVDQSFTVGKASQTITFGALSNKSYGDQAFSLSATASSGLPVSFSITSGGAYASISGSQVTITGVGSVTVRASQAGNANYNAATDVDQTFTVGKGNQTITFGALATKYYGDPAFSVTATASSGLTVNLAVASGPATISGNTVTLTGVGTVTIRASQAGNANFNAATVVDQSFTVGKGSQTITFGTLSNKVYTDAPFNVSATASSGLPVSFSISAGNASISGSTVTLSGAGTVTIRASQAGGNNYNAAANVDQSFTISKANQSITFAALNNKTVGDPAFAVSATASSGLAVTFALAAGPATISGNTVTLTGAGTVTIRASQGGDNNFNAAANVDQSFTVSKGSQTITFGQLANRTFGDPAFTVSAAASSSLPVTFAIASGPATISGSSVTVNGVGTVTVRASQAGNESYNAAPDVDQSFTVGKANQTITFGALNNRSYGEAPFTISATASSGLPVSFAVVSGLASISGSTVTVNGVGTVTIRASQGGNDNFNAATAVDQSFSVGKGAQTITFGALGSKSYGDPPFAVSASSSAGLPVAFEIASGPATISGNTVTVNGVGTVTVRAVQVGNENYNAAPNVEQSFAVGKGNQTISFGALNNKVYGDAPFAVSATASSGLPVAFAVANGPAQISGNNVTITGAGAVTIRASQAGDANYNAAPNVDQSFTVSKANQTITFAALSNRTVGDPAFSISATASSGLAVNLSVASGPASISGNSVTVNGAGNVTIRAGQAGDANYNAAANVDQTFLVSKGSQSITFNPVPNKTYGDAAFALSASASSGLPVSFSVVTGLATISGNSLALNGAGTVTIRASQSGNESFNAAADVDQTFSVAKANQTITFGPPGNRSCADQVFSLSGTASSGLPVSFSVLSGPGNVSGNTLAITGIGTITVRASQPGNSNFNVAAAVDQSFSVNQAGQSISFGALAAKVYGDPLFTVSANASSGLPVNFEVVSGPASLSGGNVTINGVGTVIVRATQSGNDCYGAAAPVEQSFVVGKGNQTINFGTLNSRVFGEAAFSFSATASSGLPVSFRVLSGPATISANSVTLTGAGTVTIRASQAGNNNYYSAPDVDQSFTVGKGSQTITFGALGNRRVGDAPFTLTANASSGLAVSFSIVSGPASISGNSVTVTGAGTVTVRASQAGDNNYNAAVNADQAFTVEKANQTITFGPLANRTFGVPPFNLGATASSGLPVSYAIASGPATISGATLSISGVGTVTVRASQAGDNNYTAAPNVDQSFTIGKADQTISFAALANRTFGDPPVSLAATASSGLPVTFSVVSGPANLVGGALVFQGAGTVVVRAGQSGDANFNAAPNVEQAFTVGKANQTITFPALANRTFGDPPVNLAASSSSLLPVAFSLISGPATLSGNTATLVGAGTVVVRAGQAGDANYNAAPSVDQTFSVAKGPQTITFGPLAPRTFRDPPFAVNATTSSGLPVTFSIVSGPASVSGNLVTISGAGTVVVRASQAGNENFGAAQNVDQSLEVRKASQTITFAQLPSVITVSTPFSVTATASSGLPVTISVAAGPASVLGNTITVTGTEPVVLQATQAGNENFNPATEALPISAGKQNQTITFEPLPDRVFGDSAFALQSTASSGLPVGFIVVSGPAELEANTVRIIGAGTVTIRASQPGNDTFNPAADVVRSFVVARARQTITFPPVADQRLADPPFALNATASSGLPVAFTLISGPATLTGNTVTLTGAGTVTVQAAQAGNENFEPAPEVSLSFRVDNAAPTISSIPEQSTAANTATLAIPFTVGDPDGPLTGLKLTVGSSNTVLVPVANIVLAGQGAARTITILPAQNQSGTTVITVLVEDAGGAKAQTQFTLTVTSQPLRISNAPENRTVIEGANVTFVVTATGQPPIVYQWRFNGALLSGESNPSLVLTNVRSSQAGTYQVTITNATGSVSASATLQVTVPVRITRQPDNQSVAAGATAAFAVEATGSAPIRYQWQFNGLPLAAQTNSVLQISNATTANAGEYAVIVSNSAGSTASSPARLVVAVPPSITRQPQSQSIVAGSTISFNVGVSGTEPLRFEWRLNGVALPSATNVSITINNTQSANAGDYTVVVSNSAGSVTSDIARLTVNSPVQITAQPSSLVRTQGQSANFSVTAVGTAPLTYQWRQNGVNIPGAIQSTLTIASVQSTHAGNYQVLVSNASGPVLSTSATLTVNIPVTILEPPVARTVSEGDAATFAVVAAGTSPLTYQWQKNSVNIPGATSSSLAIANARASDAGTYRVIVSNVVGPVTSAAVALRVLVPPTIQTQPSSVKIDPGANASFTVVAVGDAPLSYQWQKNGINLPGQTGTGLTINNVTAADAGNYTVVVENPGGAATSSRASLTLNLPTLSSGKSAQDAPPPIEAAEGTFDGGSNETGGVTPLVRKNAPSTTPEERWFSWKAPSSGVATFNTVGSTFDTVLTVFSGAAGNLVRIVSDDDSGGYFASQANFNATQGTTYLINVKGFGGSTGRIVVGFKLVPTTQLVPIIVAQPEHRTVTPGAPATLTVQAQGTGLRFQWYKNGIAQPGEDFPQLLIPNAGLADIGNYTVRISAGPTTAPLTVESTVASVQLGTENISAQDKFQNAPRVVGGIRPASFGEIDLLQTSSNLVAHGFVGSLTFSTTGSSKEPGEPNHDDVAGGASEWITYQAPANGVLRVSTDGSDFDTVLAVYSGSGTNFSSLKAEATDNNSGSDGQDSVVNLSVSLGTLYFIAVDGVKGASGRVNVRYELGQGPVISRQPITQSVALGSNVTFSVETTNALSGVTTNLPAVQYQWLRDGLKITSETNRILTIVNAQVKDNGNYAAVVSSFAGAVTSVVARLTVSVPLTLTSQPRSQTVSAGTPVIFAAAVSGSEPIAYQWRLNGTNIAGATNSIYTIASSQSNQAGNYTLFATNPAGSIESAAALLTVGLGPTITQQPSSSSAATGDQVVLTVIANGSGVMAYQWHFNGVDILGANSSSLILNNVQQSNAGNYTVEIANQFGTRLSNPAAVTVTTQLRVAILPLSQTVATGDSAVFTAIASGSGNLLYQWKHGTTEIPNATNSTLVLTSVQVADAGIYSVLVKDATGRSVEGNPASLVVSSPVTEFRISKMEFINSLFQFELTVPAGQQARVQTSADFLQWENLSDNIYTGVSIIKESPPPNVYRRFYRAVLEERPN